MVGWHPVTATRLGVALAKTEGREPGDGKARLHIESTPLCRRRSPGLFFFFGIAGATLAYGSLTPA